MTILCPSCGAQMLPEYSFCGFCGEKLKTSCPNCLKEIPKSFSFCPYCGVKLKETQPKVVTRLEKTQVIERKQVSAEEGKLETEKRFVTILFADISGFTRLSEQLEAEELQSFITKVLNELAQIVRKYGGYVDKFIGDEVMALFGAPRAYGNDAQRAVECALEMMDFIKEKYPQISLHCGIATGEVVVGSVSGKIKDYTAMGDTVNVAKRLEESSKSGEILADGSTVRLTRWEFEWRKRDDVVLKGKTQKVDVYQLEGRRKVVLKVREREKRQVLDALQNGKRFICVVGEEGVGVTTFLDIIKSSLKDSVKVSAMPTAEPFSLVRDVLSEIFEDEAEGKLSELFPAKKDIVMWIFGKLPENSPLRWIPQDVLEKRAFEFLEDVFQKFARGKTIIIDDFEVADDLSARFFLNLPNGKGTSFSLIVSTSPDREKQFDGWVKVKLKRYSKDEMREFLEDWFSGQISDKLLDFLWEKTEGNLLFALELLEEMKEKGLLKFNGKVQVVDIPKQIQAWGLKQLILSRIDKLSPLARRVASVLSLADRMDVRVLMKYFETEGVEKEEVQEAFSELSKYLSFERTFVFFKSKVVREVLSETVLKRKKQEIYKKLFDCVQDILRESSEEDFNLTYLASQFALSAGDRKNAFHYLSESAKILTRRMNWKYAVEFFEKAFQVFDENLDVNGKFVFDTLFEYGKTLYNLGKTQKAFEIFKKAQKFAPTERENENALLWMADTIHILGEYEKALELYRKLLSSKDKVIRAKTNALLCHLFVEMGKPEEGISYGMEAVKIQDVPSDVKADAFNALGRAFLLLGQIDKATEFFQKFYEEAEKSGNLRLKSVALLNLSVTFYTKGDYLYALSKIKEHISLAESLGDIRNLGISYGNLGIILFETGRPEEGEKNLRKAIELLSEAKDRYALCESLKSLATFLWIYGEDKKALEIVERLSKMSDLPSHLAVCSLVWASSGNGEKAQRAVENLPKSWETEITKFFLRGNRRHILKAVKILVERPNTFERALGLALKSIFEGRLRDEERKFLNSVNPRLTEILKRRFLLSQESKERQSVN